MTFFIKFQIQSKKPEMLKNKEEACSVFEECFTLQVYLITISKEKKLHPLSYKPYHFYYPHVEGKEEKTGN